MITLGINGSIQIRRDTIANWAATNPTMLAGEQGYETDGNRMKVGDGVTAWNDLIYVGSTVAYELPAATSTLGGVKPDGATIIDTAGAISVAFGTSALTSAEGNDSRITGALSATTAASTYVPKTTTVNGHDLSAAVVVSASDLTTGTLPHAQLPTLLAADIPAIAESNVTNLTTDLASKVPTSQTVNGHALSAPVVISASDLTTGTLPHAQLPALMSGDIPNNAANTSGTAANVSGTPALPAGTTATTQAVDDNTTKLATDAFVLGQAASANPSMDGSVAVGTSTRFARADHVHASDTSRVPTSQTVNGHSLTGAVVVSASDLTTGTLPHAQLPTLLSGDIPANAANTSGTAAGLSGTPALPNGTAATTQAVNDNTTKIATDAFVLAQAASTNPAMDGAAAVGTGTTFARADHVHASDTSRVATTVTVNGHALSSNVTVSASDLATGNLPIAQIPTGGSSTTYLRGDGSWQTPAGAGNVTNTGTSVVGGIPAYTDTTGSQVAPSALSMSSLNGFRNRIINGDMRIDQRYSGASVTPVLFQYLVDRWQYQSAQASKFTFQQNAGAVTPPVGFTNYLGATVASSYAIAGSDYFALSQFIEGLNAADLAWGTANAQAVTLSFWVRSTLTGTFGGSIRNGAITRSYPFTYAIGSANTWTKISITIPGDTAGTWATDNTSGPEVFFGLGVGSTYVAAAGSWTAGNYLSAIGAVSVVGTSSATFYITGVQLELGSVATPFERRPYGLELSLCQRYYQKLGGSVASDVFFSSYTSASGAAYGTFTLPVTMRTSPTTNVIGSWTSVNNQWVNNDIIQAVSPSTFSWCIGGMAAGPTQYYTTNTTTYITLSAEL